jgi:hypothetical protein
MESHDEERIMFKNKAYGRTQGNYNVQELTTGLQRTAAATVIFFAIPGPKMVWQFGELGYDFELNNDRLGKKPIRWDYYDVPDRKALYDVFAKMFALRKDKAALFAASDYTISLAGQFKYIVLKSGGETAVAIANFDVVPLTQNVPFGKIGTWHEHFTDATLDVQAASESITLEAGEYRLYFN